MSCFLQLAFICMALVSMTMAIPKLSEKEEACLKKRKFYYAEKNDCFELLTRGPCAEDEWFVMRSPEPGDKEAIVRGVCRKNECPGSYYWPETGDCVTSKDKVKLCGNANNVTLAHNDFGDGECTCKKIPVHGRINDEYNSTCYQLYRRGPCPLGEIVGVPEGKTSPVCMKDSCFDDSVKWKLSGKIPFGASLARWNGTCYQLGTRGPCDNDTLFQVTVRRRPECVSLVNGIFDLEKPQDCTSYSGRCQTTVQIANPDDSYKESALASLSQQRNRHRHYALRNSPFYDPSQDYFEEIIEIIF